MDNYPCKLAKASACIVGPGSDSTLQQDDEDTLGAPISLSKQANRPRNHLNPGDPAGSPVGNHIPPSFPCKVASFFSDSAFFSGKAKLPSRGGAIHERQGERLTPKFLLQRNKLVRRMFAGRVQTNEVANFVCAVRDVVSAVLLHDAPDEHRLQRVLPQDPESSPRDAR